MPVSALRLPERQKHRRKVDGLQGTPHDAPQLFFHFTVATASRPKYIEISIISANTNLASDTSLQQVHFPMAATVKQMDHHSVLMFCMPSPYS